MSDTSNLVTVTLLITKISKVDNKILNTSNLLTTTVLNTKISEYKKFLIILNRLFLRNLIN